jgi:hypothetical protein
MNENLPQQKINLSPSVTGCESKCTGAYTECSATYWPNFRSTFYIPFEKKMSKNYRLIQHHYQVKY